MQVENIGGVQKIRLKLPAWLLVSKSQVASGTNPTGFFTWTDNVSRKHSLLIYNYRELAEDAVAGTPSLAGAAPFSIPSLDTLREIVVTLAKEGVEEICCSKPTTDVTRSWSGEAAIFLMRVGYSEAR